MSASGAADQLHHEAVIIGAGPAGLWAAFQLGIHGVRSVLIDSNHQLGGQCAALYADKPVFDMPGFATIEAGDITVRLADQIERFQPHILLGECVTAVRETNGGFDVTTHADTKLTAAYVILATGLGAFGIEGKAPALQLPETAVQQNGHPLVSSDTFQSTCKNLYAIGDAIEYPGKLCLLVSAFHEAALMAFAIRKKRAGEKRAALEHTSTSSALKAVFTDR